MNHPMSPERIIRTHIESLRSELRGQIQDMIVARGDTRIEMNIMYCGKLNHIFEDGNVFQADKREDGDLEIYCLGDLPVESLLDLFDRLRNEK